MVDVLQMKTKPCHLYFQRSYYLVFHLPKKVIFWSQYQSRSMWWLPPPPSASRSSFFFFFLISVFAEHFGGAWKKSVRDHGVGMRTGGVSSGSWFLRFRWSVNLEVLPWKPQMTGAVFKSLMLLTRTGHTLWAAEFASEWDCWTLDQWCDSSCICLY